MEGSASTAYSSLTAKVFSKLLSAPVRSNSASRNARTYILQLALTLAFCIGISVAQSADTSGGTTASTPTSTASFATPVQITMAECQRTLDIQAQSVLVCNNYLDLYPVLKFAEQVGRDECQKAFQGSKWNCSSFSILKPSNIVRKDIAETAYIRALQVAVIAHTVAKACRTRTLASCGCATFNANTMPQDGNTYSGDCSDNFEFGYQFALNFTTSGITSTTVQAKTDIHNFNTGINAVRDLMASTVTPPKCKCIGVSGSCTTQVCWQEAPDFSVVGSSIKKLFDSALQVIWNQQSGTNSNWISPGGSIVTDKTLIYGNQSPNWCYPDPTLNFLGVTGRQCDPNSSGSNSCKDLCCDHGYVQTQITNSDCNCKFVYCCSIQCLKCHTVITTYVCL